MSPGAGGGSQPRSVVADHLRQAAAHAGSHLADARELVGPGQGRDNGVERALVAVLDVQGMGIGR